MPFGTISSRVTLNKACLQTVINFVISQRLGVDQQIGPVDAVDADRCHAFARGLDEPVMVPAQMQPRLRSPAMHVVDRRLTRVAAPRLAAPALGSSTMMNGRARLVRHQNVDIATDCLHASTSSRTKCRRLSSRGVCGRSLAGVSNHVGANVPPRPATRSGPTVRAVPFGMKCRFATGSRPASHAAMRSKSSLLPLIQ